LLLQESVIVTKFTDLGLSSTLLLTLEKEGYTKPTPIQSQAIPILLKGHDLLGIAQTGTGKTAAFALPIIQGLLTNRKVALPRTVRALILSPTRELASQIAESFTTYGRGLGLSVATVYGGVKYGPQFKALARGTDILVATPGRLIDHLEQKTVDLSQVEYFVLDEADQMLDLGFVKPIRQVASRLPKQRQNLFFSATMPKEIGQLAAELLTEPKRVEVTPEATTAERVAQSVIFVEAQRKRALLSEFYADEALNRTLVFTRTKRGADRVAAYLQAGGIEAAAIHGEKSQGQRERALQAFKAGKVRALVATDIAARGIDVDNVSHVINYELPNVAEAYVHRIGRTARAGREGIAISLCADDERNLLKAIEKTTRQRIPSFDRRKDQALKLFDEAMIASGVAEKPVPPERIPAKKEARHFDPDAEKVHKRSRNRPGKKFGDRKPGKSFGDRSTFADTRPIVYDPLAAERPAAAKPAKAKKDWSREAPRHDGGRTAAPRDDRRAEGRNKRPGKPGFKAGKPNPAHTSEAPRPRSEGAQFKRRNRS